MFRVFCGSIFLALGQTALRGTRADMHPANSSCSSAGAEANGRLKRPGRAEEVATAILFLASDDASYVTGALRFMDGNMTAL